MRNQLIYPPVALVIICATACTSAAHPKTAPSTTAAVGTAAEQAFVADMRANAPDSSSYGATEDASLLISTGHKVCSDLAYPGTTTVLEAGEFIRGGMTAAESTELVSYAKRDLCPTP